MDWLQQILTGVPGELSLGGYKLAFDSLTLFGSLTPLLHLPIVALVIVMPGLKNKAALFDWLVPALLWPLLAIVFVRINCLEITRDFAGAHAQVLQCSAVLLVALLIQRFLLVAAMSWPPSPWSVQTVLALFVLVELLTATPELLVLIPVASVVGGLVAWQLQPPIDKEQPIFTVATAYYVGLCLSLWLMHDFLNALAELAGLAIFSEATIKNTPQHLLANAVDAIPVGLIDAAALACVLFFAAAVGSDIRSHWQPQRLALHKRIAWKLKPRLPIKPNYKRRAVSQLVATAALALWAYFTET